jgi:hypothetical protein
MWTVFAWLLVAALAGFFIYMITNQQKASAMSTSTGAAGAAGTASSTGVVYKAGSPTDVQVPASALSNGPTGRPICEAPLDPCVGAVQNGFIQGDPRLYPGSWTSPLYFNTGAWSMPCGEMPTNCLNC